MGGNNKFKNNRNVNLSVVSLSGYFLLEKKVWEFRGTIELSTEYGFDLGFAISKTLFNYLQQKWQLFQMILIFGFIWFKLMQMFQP